ncbi:MAG TPA: hypothetical protein VNU97_07515 [Rhizomicrobium sp.]|jgi:hypothetical protein|nr:hypothetical protein [Rhizomicrobium sp.]
MSDAPLKVVRSQQSKAALDLIVECPEHVLTSMEPGVSIVDIFGRHVPIATVKPMGSAGTAALAISADLHSVDPEADAPSYLLTVGQYATWFAPASPRGLVPGTTQSKPPPGAAGIDYLGRDYTAFTAMMRSRVSQIVEDDSAWALDHPADPLTTILEVLAYAGDHLSFRQDAAGTESYLTTARHRLSLRRHARLCDYAVDDGCNARTALVFAVNADGVLPAGLQVVTLQPGETEVILPSDAALAASTAVFETMHAQPVWSALNDLGPALVQSAAYTIAAGAITLTLQGSVSGLVPGQFVVLRQLNAPEGVASAFGAQVLRLLKVEAASGAAGTVLSWHPEDALKSPLTIPPAQAQGTVSLYGNVVLADHGRTVAAAPQPATVPSSGAYTPLVLVQDVVSAAPPPRIAAAFDGTQDLVAASLMVESAKASLNPDPRRAAPCISMSGTRPGMAGVTDTWNARQDLLSSSSTERSFAAALEDGFGGGDRYLNLRFGDGVLGYPPAPGTVFTAATRSADGQSGQVRAGSLVQIIGPAPLVTWVANPLPATPSSGEESEAIRLFATTSFRTNLRGIEPADWDLLGNLDPLVAEIHATLGANKRAPCTVGLTTTATIPDGITFPVASARLMDHAVLGAPPTIVPSADVELEIALIAYCVPGTNIAAARTRLQQRVGTGALPDGSPAFFNPALWPLGRQVRLDELLRAIGGDASVAFTVFDPRLDPRVVFRTVYGGDDTAANVAQGRIAIGTHQRARVGNDNFHPALGSIRIYVGVMS